MTIADAQIDGIEAALDHQLPAPSGTAAHQQAYLDAYHAGLRRMGVTVGQILSGGRASVTFVLWRGLR